VVHVISPHLPQSLQTERLLLRHWRDEDVDSFATLNADAQVMEHFPSLLSREQTDTVTSRIRAHFTERGFGLWAVELKETGEFIGFVGLQVPTFDAHFMPCVEVGWRLDKRFWGKGYAPEAAVASLRDGYERLGLEEIVSMTTTTNKKSMRVMEKLGMSRDPADDFDHPRIPEGHRLRRHVLYRLSKKRWHEMQERR
jgi:RimJ/RimL family protein N-acetyltransferase